jgi:methionyl aminopeptidase
MIILKTSQELSLMREAGRITGGALAAGMEACKPGATTMDVNRAVHHFITSHGAVPSFLGYGGFPAAACVSVNDEVIHGIPSKKRILREGDIVSIDVGACFKGYHGDSAATVGVGAISAEAQQLLDVTARSLEMGIAQALKGNRIGDIGAAVQQYAESFGYGVVRDFVGHGIGTNVHEDPEVPNYGRAGRGPRLMPGMTIAIEPMINLRGADVEVQPDGWTVLTASGSLSAHFEHTVAITDNGPVVLTTRP